MPVPLPPCAVEDGPPKPGFNTSIFTCMEPRTHNLSYVACTIFHGERTNVTCVTPEFAVACDVPAFEPDNALRKWWQNNATPSHSFYNEHVQSVSCIARGMREQEVGFVGGAADIHKTRGGGFKDRRKLYGADEGEVRDRLPAGACHDRRRRRAARAILPFPPRNSLLFTGVPDGVRHRAPERPPNLRRDEQLGSRLGAILRSAAHFSDAAHPRSQVFDATIDDHLREFVWNDTLYHERTPAQYMEGVGPDVAGQRREVLNQTCTLPAMTPETHGLLNPYTNLIGGLRHDGRPNHRCSRPLTPRCTSRSTSSRTSRASAASPRCQTGRNFAEFLNRNELMVCHEPQLEATNTTMGPYVPPEEAAEAVRRRLYGGADDEGEADGAAEGAAGGGGPAAAGSMGDSDDDGDDGDVDDAAAAAAADAAAAAAGGGATARRRSSTGTSGGYQETHGGDATGGEWDWHRAVALRDARNATRARRQAAARPASGLPARRQLQAGRRRLLYHEFETELSPWDLWLDENEEEKANREAREEAMRTGDCHFYHNCTAPLPPPLVLDPFDCWKPNASNVSWLPPVLFRNPHYDEANENTTYFRTTVHCIRPSWPDADGIWCLTPHSALFCPFPDQYRGNRTELQADTEATTRSADPFSPLYVNDTSLRCHSWKVDDVYDSLASQRALFPLKPHSSTTAPSARKATGRRASVPTRRCGRAATAARGRGGSSRGSGRATVTTTSRSACTTTARSRPPAT